jgi:hypothetical protein
MAGLSRVLESHEATIQVLEFRKSPGSPATSSRDIDHPATKYTYLRQSPNTSGIAVLYPYSQGKWVSIPN